MLVSRLLVIPQLAVHKPMQTGINTVLLRLMIWVSQVNYVSSSYWCYINDTLQALIAFLPFVHLIKSLGQFISNRSGQSQTPRIESVCVFFYYIYQYLFNISYDETGRCGGSKACDNLALGGDTRSTRLFIFHPREGLREEFPGAWCSCYALAGRLSDESVGE